MTEPVINTAMDIFLYSLSNLFRIYLLRKYIRIFVGDEESAGRPLPGREREALAYWLLFVINTGLSLWLQKVWINVTVNIVGDRAFGSHVYQKFKNRFLCGFWNLSDPYGL